MPLIDVLKNKIVKRTALPLTLAGTLLVGCGKDHGPEQKPEPIIAENTKILDNSILQNISSYKEGTFTFSDSTYVAHNLSEGDIMVGGVSDNTPHGFLRKIESISQDKKIIRTTQASLEEAIEYCDIEERGTLHPPRSNRFKSTVEPTDFNFIIPLENIILYDLDGNYSTTNDQIIADGRVSFNYDYVFKLKIDRNTLGLENFVFDHILNENVNLAIDAKITENINVDKTILELPLPPFVIKIPTTPPLPIVITPEIEINLGANGEISLGSYFDVSQNIRLEAGISYENQEWKSIKSLENGFSFNHHGMEANSLIEAYAGPEAVFYIYGIAGASAEINAISKLDVDLLRNPRLRLYGGLEAKVGAEAEVLSLNILDYEAMLFNEMELLYESNDSLPPVNPTGEIVFVSKEDNYSLNFINIENSEIRTIEGTADNKIGFPIWNPNNRDILGVVVQDSPYRFVITDPSGLGHLGRVRLNTFKRPAWVLYHENEGWEWPFVCIKRYDHNDRQIRDNIQNFYHSRRGLGWAFTVDWTYLSPYEIHSIDVEKKYGEDELLEVFSASLQEGNEPKIYIKKKGCEERLEDLTCLTPSYDGHEPIWSNDSSRIYFVSTKDGNKEIYRINKDGSNVVRLTHNSSSDSYPAISPNDRYITFSSDRDGDLEIFIMDANDGESKYLKKLTDNEVDDYHPNWRPN